MTAGGFVGAVIIVSYFLVVAMRKADDSDLLLLLSVELFFKCGDAFTRWIHCVGRKTGAVVELVEGTMVGILDVVVGLIPVGEIIGRDITAKAG